MSKTRIKICHIIGSLDAGGAERALCRLLRHTNSENLEQHVVTLTSAGTLRDEVTALGVPLHSLAMRRGVPNPAAIFRLKSELSRYAPHLIVTWMYHSNLMGGIAAMFAGGPPLVWNVRDTGATSSQFKWLTRLVSDANRVLSHRLQPRIVYVSQSGRRAHEAAGYASNRSMVIPNGFNTLEFCPSATASLSLRAELQVNSEARLIGLFGRVHPDKDHQNFFKAAARIHQGNPNVRFVLCGGGATRENPALVSWIRSSGLENSTHLLGLRRDMPRLYAAMDLLVSSSSSEAFPNAVGEAMSCGTPCVVTDVGDSAYLLGDAGHVVPPRNPDALALAITELLYGSTAELKIMGMRGRRRIETMFSLNEIAQQHVDLWLSVVDGRSGKTSSARAAA